MIIKSIKLKNIRSYDEAEINFSEGSTILSGDIGSGKTSVLLAIEFALFGLQPGQKGASLLRNGKDEGSVELEFEVDNKVIKIERNLKRGKSVTQSTASLYIDNERKNLSATELKNFVLSLLNYPQEFAKKTNLLYKFTVYTQQEEMKQIILENPDIRLDTIRHIFGIDKYKRIKENTDIVAGKLREQIREYSGSIKDIDEKRKILAEQKNNIKILEEKLRDSRKILADKKSARNSIEKEIQEIKSKIEQKKNYEKEEEKTKVMILGKNEQIHSLTREKSAIIKQIDEAQNLKFDENELKILEGKIKKLETEKETLDKARVEASGKINSLNSRILESQRLKSQISSLQICPTCLQSVDEDYKQNIKRKFEDEIVSWQKKIPELEKEKETISEKIMQISKQISEINKQTENLKFSKIKLEALAEKKNRIIQIEKQIESLNTDIQMLKKQSSLLNDAAFELKKYENIYEAKERELKLALSEEKNCEILLARIEKEIEITKIRNDELEKELLEKEKLKERLIKLFELEDWLSNKFAFLISFTERNVLLKLREEFSKLFNEWFNILVPDAFTARLDEDFTPIIEQQDFALDYSFLSGGERTAIALAYRLALNQILNSLLSKIKTKSLVILDEPTDGFSEQQLDKMRDVLNQLNAKQLIIVSHEQKIESFVENIIRFKKENGKTIVESGR